MLKFHSPQLFDLFLDYRLTGISGLTIVWIKKAEQNYSSPNNSSAFAVIVIESL
jgi:hypothetical protein